MYKIALTLILSFPLAAFALEAADEESARLMPGSAVAKPPACKQLDDIAYLKANPAIKPVHTTQEAVRSVFDKNVAKIAAIYQRALRDDPCLSGVMVVKVSINEAGAVTTTGFRALNPELRKIEPRIAAVVEGLQFESTGKPDTFEYLLNFYAN
jgi:hypothetical protein